MQHRWLPYPATDDPTPHSVAGRVYRLAGLWSPQLFNDRDVYAYLPPDYGAADRRYPVVYMQDGQNLFDDATSFAGEWHIDDALEAAGGAMSCIVVGVSNAGARRLDEYTPFVDGRHGGGDGGRYLDFLIDTLKPLVDAEFATLPDREHTGIAGSSLGGLVALYGVFARPRHFGFAAVLSPSIWFADRAMLRWLDRIEHNPGRLYVDVGTAEGRRTVANARRLKRALLRKGYVEGRNLRYVEAEGAAHNEAAWGVRFPAALEFLLSHGACEPAGAGV